MLFGALVHDPRLNSKNILTSGGRRTRTDDPRLAKPMLSQLSYTPPLCIVMYAPQHHVLQHTSIYILAAKFLEHLWAFCSSANAVTCNYMLATDM